MLASIGLINEPMSEPMSEPINELVKVSPLFDTFGLVISNDGTCPLLELDRRDVLELFKREKAVLFRGFSPDLEAYQKFTSLFCADFMSYMGGGYRRKVINPDEDGTTLSVNYYLGQKRQRTFGLPLHGEMYYIDRRPEVIWFYCVRPAAKEGETTVCDGATLYQALSDRAQKAFRGQRLKYIRTYQSEDWQSRFLTDDITVVQQFCRDNGLQIEIDKASGSIRTEYVFPAVIQPPLSDRPVFINNILPVVWQEENGNSANIVRWENNTEIPIDTIQEVKDAAEQCTQLIAWQPLDIIMIDNTRVLHGRRAFSDRNREIYTRMGRSIIWS